MKLEKKNLAALAALLGLLAATAPPLHASWAPRQDEGGESASAEEGGDEGDGAKEKEEERWFALVGGDVVTGTGGILRGATILAKNGVIEEIGNGLTIPEGAEVLKVRGLRVYPGLVALGASSRVTRGLFSDEPEPEPEVEDDPHLGVDDLRPGESLFGHVEPAPEDRADAEQVDEPADGDRVDEAADEFDPFSQYLVLALATGITTVEQGNVAFKLKRGEIDGVVLSEKVRTTFALSKANPASIRSLREKFTRAAEYLREYRAWEEIKDKDEKKKREPSKKGVDTSALEVLEGKRQADFKADSREDLLEIARLAQTFGFRPVVEGCGEGWAVADELGRAGAYAILTPRSKREKDERLVRPGGTSIENAAILYRSGVQVAVTPQISGFDLGGIAGRDLLHFPIEAAFAVRGGLPEDAALAAISLVPARLLGISHRVGTIEVGKDCDVIVTDGDLLHYETFVQYAVVDGKLVYDKQKEIFFAHIRPRPEEPEEETAAPEEKAPAKVEAESGDDEGDESGADEGQGDEGEGDEGSGDGR